MAKTCCTRLHTLLWNTLQLPQSLEDCLNCQLWALSRSFKLGYPINTKKSAFLQTITFSICTRTKITVLNVIKNDTIRVFCAFRLFYRNHRCKPKFDIHSKIQSLFWLKSYFFCSYSFPGPSCSSLALPRFSKSRLHCMLYVQPLWPAM